MDRRKFLRSCLHGAAVFMGAGCAGTHRPGGHSRTSQKTRRPNILLVLADDLGWAQVGCYGTSYYQTPNIDRLARQGMRFTDAYAAAPVCSPTRASIMTGKYPARLHLTDFIAGGTFPYEKYSQPDWQKYLPLEEVTIAEVLREAGYATASFGKWHLSRAKTPPASEPFNPDRQGFDEHVVTYKPRPKDDPEGDAHNVDLITSKSLDFLRRNADRPFFLYVTHNTIHDPLIGKGRLVEKHRRKAGSGLPENNPVLGAMIEELDDSVGKLLKGLDELGIADDTVVIFFSDNGGLEHSAKQTPLRSGKANLYEGGIRVPLIVRWPDRTTPGGTCSEPVGSIDLFPTLAEVAGVRNTTPPGVDGVSLVPLLTQKGSLAERALFWHYPHYHSSSIGPCGAVRLGNYKLIEWYDESIDGTSGRFELYSLADDIGEQHDLVAELPEKAGTLAHILADWRRQVGAQMISPNPNYDPKRAKRSK